MIWIHLSTIPIEHSGLAETAIPIWLILNYARRIALDSSVTSIARVGTAAISTCPLECRGRPVHVTVRIRNWRPMSRSGVPVEVRGGHCRPHGCMGLGDAILGLMLVCLTLARGDDGLLRVITGLAGVAHVWVAYHLSSRKVLCRYMTCPWVVIIRSSHSRCCAGSTTSCINSRKQARLGLHQGISSGNISPLVLRSTNRSRIPIGGIGSNITIDVSLDCLGLIWWYLLRPLCLLLHFNLLLQLNFFKLRLFALNIVFGGCAPIACGIGEFLLTLDILAWVSDNGLSRISLSLHLSHHVLYWYRLHGDWVIPFLRPRIRVSIVFLARPRILPLVLQIGDSVLQLNLIDIDVCAFVIHLLLEAHKILIHYSKGLVERGNSIGQLSVLGLQLIDVHRLIL